MNSWLDALIVYSPLIVFALVLAYISLFVAPKDDP